MSPTARRRKRDPQRTIFIVLMLLPALAALGFFMYYPIEETFRLSLMRSHGLGQATYAGLENYIKLFKDEEFLAGLYHVIAWAFWSVVIQLPLAFFVAFSLITNANRFTKSLRAVYYMASILPSAITAMLGRFIFAPDAGVIATISTKLGWGWLHSIDFLGDPKLAFWSVFFVATWAYTGFPIVVLMARIEQIPREIREAAALDDCTGWRYAWYIVLPIISYTMRILGTLMVVGSLKLFDLPYLMTSGGPGDATKTLGIILYNQGFVNWQYGKAAAVGVVILLLSLFFTIAQFAWQQKGADAE